MFSRSLYIICTSCLFFIPAPFLYHLVIITNKMPGNENPGHSSADTEVLSPSSTGVVMVLGKHQEHFLRRFRWTQPSWTFCDIYFLDQVDWYRIILFNLSAAASYQSLHVDWRQYDRRLIRISHLNKTIWPTNRTSFELFQNQRDNKYAISLKKFWEPLLK
jgi:hypothetical protein